MIIVKVTEELLELALGPDGMPAGPEPVTEQQALDLERQFGLASARLVPVKWGVPPNSPHYWFLYLSGAGPSPGDSPAWATLEITTSYPDGPERPVRTAKAVLV